MIRRFIARRLALAATRIPGLRRVPALKLLAVAELTLLAREHLLRLTPQERRRVIALMRAGRVRRRNLSAEERAELAWLIAKTQPRAFAGQAAAKLSPWPLPGRVVYGRRRR
jgi:hypothetical protein